MTKPLIMGRGLHMQCAAFEKEAYEVLTERNALLPDPDCDSSFHKQTWEEIEGEEEEDDTSLMSSSETLRPRKPSQSAKLIALCEVSRCCHSGAN